MSFLLLLLQTFLRDVNSICDSPPSPWIILDIADITNNPILNGTWFIAPKFDASNNCKTYSATKGSINPATGACTYDCAESGTASDYSNCPYLQRKVSPIYRLPGTNYYLYYSINGTRGNRLRIVKDFTTICSFNDVTDGLQYITDYDERGNDPPGSFLTNSVSYFDNKPTAFGRVEWSLANGTKIPGDYTICEINQLVEDPFCSGANITAPTVMPTKDPTLMPTDNPTPSPTLPRVKYDIKRVANHGLRDFAEPNNVTINALINLDKTITITIDGPYNYTYGFFFAKTDIFAGKTTFVQLDNENILGNNNVSGYIVNPYLLETDENFLFEVYGYDTNNGGKYQPNATEQNTMIKSVMTDSKSYTNIVLYRNQSNYADMLDFNFADFSNLIQPIYVCFVSSQFTVNNPLLTIPAIGEFAYFTGDCTSNCFKCKSFDFDGNYQIETKQKWKINGSDVMFHLIYDPFDQTLKGNVIKPQDLFLIFGSFYDGPTGANDKWFNSFIFTTDSKVGDVKQLSSSTFTPEYAPNPDYVETTDTGSTNFTLSPVNMDSRNNGWDTVKFLNTGEITIDILWKRGSDLSNGDVNTNNYNTILNQKLILQYNTDAPTIAPTKTPSRSPTLYPTEIPSITPTQNTKLPTSVTDMPTTIPTNMPSTTPTTIPTSNPSTTPSKNPSNVPTTTPSNNPSQTPTMKPTQEVVVSPTAALTQGTVIGIVAGGVGAIILIVIIVILVMGCREPKDDGASTVGDEERAVEMNVATDAPTKR